jgi:hypothetical protein
MEAKMLEGFSYRMPRWHPFQDQAACERVRAIKREDITKTPSPHLKIRVIRDDEFTFRMIMEIFGRIKQASDEGERLVLILPQPEPLYSWAAHLCNKFRVSCRSLYTFNMDEYADENGNIAPESWPNSFMYNMKVNFYAKLRSSWNAFRVGSSMVSWQRFTIRLAAHGPITPLVPSTMLQMAPSELYISESLAANIEPASVEEFSWYV